ncbi:hypothetical protein BDR05DRAFT_949882 [Suillus weaverae]|nr:hypothetical protein BDR05DRAFT_949882 [Suillus weaverae]
MSSQPAVRFHEPPVTECNSMEVDDSSESWMSLDELDAIYLGPDDELDSDSGSSSGPDVLNAIPDQSHLALTDDLPLFNDPDLYLGPEDGVIEFDDAPAIPDSPMTVSDSTPEPHSASPAVREAPMTYHLGDYKQHHGNLPDPTVAQLLESHRPFRNTWAETCDKLQKADADLRRMQRIRQLTVEMLETHYCILYLHNTWYMVPGALCSVLGIRDSGLGVRDSGLSAWEPRTLNFGAQDSGVWDLIFSIVSSPELRTPNFGARDSVLGVWCTVLGARCSVLGTRCSGLGTWDLTFRTQNLIPDF